LETAIDSYKAAYNFYPPSGNKSAGNIPINPLYYELIGTTNNDATFQTLDYSSVPLTASQVNSAFGMDGFVNCNSTNKVSSEDSPLAKSFLSGLKPQQTGTFTTNGASPFFNVVVLFASAGGPDQGYQPLGASGLNPWRYVSPGVNNPGGYDLWIQLVIKGQTNLICNWSKQVQINYPLP
jgi:hypothetical protein